MILIIDDDKAVRTSLLLLLEQEGYMAKGTSSVNEAIAWMHHNAPSLIILDLNCDPADPLGLIADIKADPETAAIPLVGFVSHVQAELRQKAQAAGCDTVVARSVFAQNLPEILARCVTM